MDNENQITDEHDRVIYMFGEFSEEGVGGIEVDGTVTVDAERYAELIEAEAFLQALEAAGVDSWDGYDLAEDIFNAFNQGA